MAEDRIDSIIDLQKVQAELDATSKGVKDLVALIQSVKGKGLDIMAATNVADVNKLSKELAGLKGQASGLATSIIDTNKAIKAQAVALEENIKKQTEYKNRIKEISEELKTLKAAQEIVNKSTAPGNDDEKKAIQEKIDLLNQELAVKKVLDREVSKTITNQIKEKEGLVDTTKALDQQEKARKKEAEAATKQAAASEKAAKKAAEEARPYRQLALAFAAAAKEAQDLAAKYGTMDKRSQAAAKRANELNNELKKIDASIGNHQRNVGNYSSAFDKVGASVSRLTTNFLGLLGIVSVGSIFKDSVDEFLEMDRNVRQLQNTLKNVGVPEAFDRISDSANRLAKQFTYLDNDEIIKSFNQLIVYGKLTEKQMNELIPVIIDFAAASGQTLEGATSTVIKALEGNGKALKEYGINMRDAKTTTEAFGLIMTQLKPKVDGVGKAFADSSAGGIATAKQDFKDLKEEVGEGLIPALNFLLRVLSDVVNGFKVAGTAVKEFFSGGTGAFQVNVDAINKDTNFAATVQQQLEQRISSYEAIQKNIETQLGRKLTQSKEDQKLLKDTQETVLKGFKASADNAQKEINAISKTLKNTQEDTFKLRSLMTTVQASLGAVNKLSASTSVIGIGNPDKPFTATKGEDPAKKAAELAERIRKANFEATKAQQEELVKIQEEIYKDETQSFDVRISALRQFIQEKARLIELERQFEKGTPGIIAEEIIKIEADKQTDLNELVRNGHQEYNKILGKEQEEEVKRHKETADRVKKVHEDLQKDVAAGVKAANDAIREAAEARDKEVEDLQKSKEDLRVELINESEALIFDILTAGFDRRKNLIQDEIDLLERKKQKDIEVANATITNAQDRAAAITVINARAEAEAQILEQKKRQIDLQRARFEKAQSVASIITNTAVAVVKSLDKPALIPLIVAIGAAQLARVIATPIPRFKQGGKHKGGLMIVGDGGKSEGIELPDGTVMKSPATSTLMDAPKGTVIHKDYSKMMLKATVTNVPVYKETTRSDSTPLVVAGLKSVEKAIKKIPQQHITVENVIRKSIRSGNSTTIHAS